MHANKSTLFSKPPPFLHPSELMKHRIFDLFKRQQKNTRELCIAGEGRAIMKILLHLFAKNFSCGKQQISQNSMLTSQGDLSRIFRCHT